MRKLIDGQTVNTYAIQRMVAKARLHGMADNTREGIPKIRKRNGELTKCLPAPQTTEYFVPEGITKISQNAFVPCASDKVDACYHNPLERISLPASMETVAPSAFGCCFFLETIELDGNNMFFQSIDGVLFSKDGKKLLAFPAGRMEENYVVPEGVEVIGENAFQNSCVYQITMPSTLKEIEDDAFWFSYSTVVDLSKATVEKVGKRIFDDVADMTVITKQNCFGDGWENVTFKMIESI